VRETGGIFTHECDGETRVIARAQKRGREKDGERDSASETGVPGEAVARCVGGGGGGATESSPG